MGAFSASIPGNSYCIYPGSSGGKTCPCAGALIEIMISGVARFQANGLWSDAYGCYMCSDCGMLPYASGAKAVPYPSVALGKPVPYLIGTESIKYMLKKPESVKSCECGAKKTYKAPPKSNLHSSWCPEA